MTKGKRHFILSLCSPSWQTKGSERTEQSKWRMRSSSIEVTHFVNFISSPVSFDLHLTQLNFPLIPGCILIILIIILEVSVSPLLSTFLSFSSNYSGWWRSWVRSSWVKETDDVQEVSSHKGMMSLLHSWDQVVKRTTEKGIHSFLYSSPCLSNSRLFSHSLLFPRNVSFARDEEIQMDCYLHWLVQEWENEEEEKKIFARKSIFSWSNSQSVFPYPLASCFPFLRSHFRFLIFKSLLTNNTCVGIFMWAEHE